jgi:CDP-glucose 4,6-dehydratase
MARIIITGANGFIGSRLTEELYDLHHKVIALDKSDNRRSYFFLNNLHKKAVFHKINILNRNNLEKIIIKNKPDYIYHLAAQTLVDAAYKDPFLTLKTNIMGTVNILECVRKLKSVKSVIIASSDKAYGKLTKGKYIENDPLKGDHPYEVSKSSTDLIAQSYYKTYKLPVVITRFGNVYGEGDLNFSRIVPGMMKTLITGKELLLRSNGKYIRDYVYVKDVVKGYISLIKYGRQLHGEAFNFGSNDSYTVLKLINLVEKVFKKNLRFRILNNTQNEIFYQSLDFSKAVKILKWKPISFC